MHLLRSCDPCLLGKEWEIDLGAENPEPGPLVHVSHHPFGGHYTGGLLSALLLMSW